MTRIVNSKNSNQTWEQAEQAEIARLKSCTLEQLEHELFVLNCKDYHDATDRKLRDFLQSLINKMC
ncbi:MAG: hypothetical protein FWG64_00845 [Firmicutes bacterium]|nr:hypothetical protein [Bacillota bacterium]